MSAEQEFFPGWESIFNIKNNGQDIRSEHPTGLEDLIRNGLADSRGKRISKPARHFSSILNQIAFSSFKKIDSFDSLLAPFIREDKLSFPEIKQDIQGLAFALLYRSKEQETSCLKIRLDLVCPDSLRERKAIVGGKELPYAYATLANEAGEINRALQEILDTGNAEGEPFTCISIFRGSENAGWEEELPPDISYELFTMNKCTKCAAVRDFIALSHLEGEEISVDKDKGFDRASEAGVFVTPTVIFYNKDKEEIARAHNVQELESVLVLLKGRS